MSIELKAQTREDLGKGASRRLRRLAMVPAVVYGAGEPQSIKIEHKTLWKAQEAEAFFSTTFSLEIDGKATEVFLKDLQRHPAKDLIMHADFQRADANIAIIVNVPVHFMGVELSDGVKFQGGVPQYLNNLVEVKCLPGNLPEFLELDMSACNAGDILHISDIKLPEGVASIALGRGKAYDLALAQVKLTKG
ncbi:MAG: 50S ribosomal protein L25/general stress protein Ctc [Sinobacterium sp.]|nr:50S ribosomal protein L25/general stress protein Ctc [Sinobacterium sp.]